MLAPGQVRSPLCIKRGVFSLLISQTITLITKLDQLLLASVFHAAFLDKFYYFRKFVSVEPHAILFARVYDHSGSMGEIASIHELFAFRTWDVADLGD